MDVERMLIDFGWIWTVLSFIFHANTQGCLTSSSNTINNTKLILIISQFIIIVDLDGVHESGQVFMIFFNYNSAWQK